VNGSGAVGSPKAIGSSRRTGGRTPPLHVVTDDRVVRSPAFLDRASAVLAAAGPCLALHLRAPRAGGRRLFELARYLIPLARSTGATLVINDRCDVALAVRSHGVHLGERSLPARAARRLLGEAVLLGRSVHAPAGRIEAGTAEPMGVLDYLFVGTLYPTASHPGRPGCGVSALAGFATTGIPLVGIGGITPERVAAVRRAGASGVAVLGGVWDSDDPVDSIHAYLREWSGAA
jgi:thiamine-phosphate pyrophosphorylase